jgi:hypothetical protein
LVASGERWSGGVRQRADTVASGAAGGMAAAQASRSPSLTEMDEFLTTSVIHWYEDVEDRLLEFLRFVPLTDANLSVTSPPLAGVITEACNILDSVFREVSPPVVTVAGKAIPRDDLDITDFAKLYAARFDLPNTKSIALVSPPRYVIPFDVWAAVASGGGPYKPAPWWTAYTKLKHNRIAEINRATLESTVQSVCALHQVIARLPEFARASMRHGWLQSGMRLSVEYVVEQLEKGGRTPDPHLVETKLFATPVGRPDQFPTNLSDFHTMNYVCSARLLRFFGRH